VACLFTVSQFHRYLPPLLNYDLLDPYHQNGNGNNGKGSDALCNRISSSLDPSSWPDIIYHKDRKALQNPGEYDQGRFSSVEEDDEQARSTIDEFNKLRKAVLTPKLLDLGVSTGSVRPARAFAGRLRTLLEGEGHEQHPLLIAVFGNSFTIGSNCGESSVQPAEDCAWPMRLARRFDEIFPRVNSSSVVEWRMYQENAQNSANVAQKIPSILDEFRNRNVTPDAILLDNTICDVNFGTERPWFEAVVRELSRSYPDTVILSLISAIPSYIDVPENHDYSDAFTKYFRLVQAHYGLAVVDVAKMVQHLRLRGNESGGDYDIVERSIDDYRQRQQRHRPVFTDAYSNENSTVIDILWPLASDLIMVNGTILHDGFYRDEGEIYWLNFLPRSRKTKGGWYPQNHPPWATHQYVADAAMHALLGVANVGLGCDGQDDYNDDDPGGMMGMGSSTSPEETVSPGDILDSCFICRSPTTKIDAKSSEHAGGHSVANLTITTEAHDIDYQAAVAVTCGDWQWITDSRNRSGWQSDQQGSLIRFRLKINKLPTLSLTYMKSHQTFGNMMVTFRALSRKEANLSPPSSLLGCDDVDKIKDLGWEGEFDFGGIYANDPSIIPALTFEGSITQYSLWETVVFPATNEYWDVNTARPWNLLNRTVLSRMMTMDSNNEYAVEYVDLYVINPSESRIKVQVVTAC
jgi:hypothetical protein